MQRSEMKVIMLGAVILNAVVLSVVIPSVIALRVVILSAQTLSLNNRDGTHKTLNSNIMIVLR
jgi:hypothetical protein